MNWDAIGAIGELIGAAAVVISVVYLAVQIRGQTSESRLAATRELSSKRTDAMKMVLADDGLLQVYLIALRDYESLEGEERLKASLMFNILMRNAEQDFIHKGTGHADDPYLESVERVLSQNVSSPGVQEWWATTGNLFNHNFQAHVNKLIAKSGRPNLNEAFVSKKNGGSSA